MRTTHTSSKTPLFLPFCTGSYQLNTLIEDACFLGTYEISRDYMKKSAVLYHEENVFRFPEKMDIKLYVV